MTPKQLREIGRSGENLAASLIEGRGFELIAANYRGGRAGEIDLVGRKRDLVVFFEVKTRRTGALGGAPYSIGRKKMASLVKAARHFLAHNPTGENTTYRFDCIMIENESVQWLEDICRNGGF